MPTGFALVNVNSMCTQTWSIMTDERRRKKGKMGIFQAWLFIRCFVKMTEPSESLQPAATPELLMSRLFCTFAAFLCFVAVTTPSPAAIGSRSEPTTLAAGEDKTKKEATPSVEDIADKAKQSVVVILYTNREGKQVGLGSGFVIDSKEGLIATNYHVIGEGRPITVRLPDGKKVDATAVHATDRKNDLAIIRIPTKGLPELPLADSDLLKEGQPIVALGHPRGLEHSVVAGVLSGRREVEGTKMLQVAIPIEQGNSGGPVLDMKGRAIGVVTLKALLTANLGFAVPVNTLKPLLEKPHPILMENWLTIGALESADWKPLLGGRWRQRSGRITADGVGTGFGGRTLCLYQRPAPKVPFEITVTVKLDDEAGAAGLIFGGDGADLHYGFYPSGGKLRLTRFAGADVFSWKILSDTKTEHYRPGDWNVLKVRVEEKRFSCWVNGHLIHENVAAEYFGDSVGLAKFRETVAEYKRFQVGDKVGNAEVPEAVAKLIEKTLGGLSLKEKELKDWKPLVKHPGPAISRLRDKARELEEQAEKLRDLAKKVHHERCLEELAAALKGDDAKADLIRAALIIARIDNEELDVDAYRQEVDRLARVVKDKMPKEADADKRLAFLNDFLFKQRGFHGSRLDYYTRANSYLNEVIDDREGLPITLSVLYMDVARQLDLKVVGVALPGHFIVRLEKEKGKGQLIDVFDGGKLLSEKDAQEKVFNITGGDLEAKHLATVPKKFIVMRMLHNLLNVAQKEKDLPSMLRYLDGILAVDPDAHEERWVRAVFRFQSGQKEGALADCEHLISQDPPDADLDRVRELRKLLMRK